MMRDAGVIWLQITGGEPTIDKDFTGAYRLASELGMMLTVSTNGSRLWRPDLLELFTTLPPRHCASRSAPTRASAHQRPASGYMAPA